MTRKRRRRREEGTRPKNFFLIQKETPSHKISDVHGHFINLCTIKLLDIPGLNKFEKK